MCLNLLYIYYSWQENYYLLPMHFVNYAIEKSTVLSNLLAVFVNFQEKCFGFQFWTEASIKRTRTSMLLNQNFLLEKEIEVRKEIKLNGIRARLELSEVNVSRGIPEALLKVLSSFLE